MPSSGPVARLQQLVSSLGNSPNEVVGAAGHPFRARLSLDAAVNHSPLNPVSFLLKAARTYPRRIAVEHPERDFTLTYEQWAWRVSDLAHALLARGVKPGDRVAVLAPNVPLVIDASQGIPAARGIIVAINTRLTKAEIAYILEHSGSSLILVDAELAHLVADAKVPVIVADDRRPDGDAYEAFLREGRKAGGEAGFANLALEPDEQAGMALGYTSGTTGRPKGCLTTYRGAWLAATSNLVESRMTIDSTYLWILPAFHASGWTFPWAITAAMCGQVCMRQVGDATDIWAFLRRKERPVTHYCAAPTVNVTILNHKSAERLAEPVCVNIAGAAPTPRLIAGLEALNIQVTHVYGLTESYGPMTRLYSDYPEWESLSDDERSILKARQGQGFYAADEVLVVKQEEEGADPNKLVEVEADGKTVGEIVFRGNVVMKEYYKDPAATKKAFAGGYFHTGDLGVRHPDGAVAIADRSKDIIISGGENASSLAIEAALAAHPSVREVAVVARPHEKYGERAHAFVILSDQATDVDGFEAELKSFSRDRLPGFARPEWVQVVDDLPRTSTGKIRKNELRDQVRKL